MNKSTKIWLNYSIGAVISLLLLWGVYVQVARQVRNVDAAAWQQTGHPLFLVLCLGLMVVNLLMEGRKWQLLAGRVAPLGFGKALGSYMAGIAFAIVTPNRVGDYPGRILYLGGRQTFRYLTVSVLGVMSQLSAIFLYGLGGLIYYNIFFPAPLAKLTLIACIIVNICISVLYWKFDGWMPFLARFRWMRRFALYGKLLNRVTNKELGIVLGLSLLRFAVFTAQYLFLLRWTNVNVPLAEGFCMAALFFWVMAVIPSVAFTGLVTRVHVSEYLFHHFSPNTVGILAATSGIWLVNLILPAVTGSILMLRMKIIG